ncbi:EcsC family protein [Bacillus sp. FJAT-42376]|uniref:EcsC family protein n=1 Tax=Bacillus sp. FJAT-42376 TaxID=2014076 RepID=UPI000F50CA38|nr:EcsC family protein [Bacillus sp. FJAT-42376]AZB44345.1 EcsC family protein [Bacillus sp. FJAT-42376]
MDSKQTLQQSLHEVEKWEKDQQGLWFWEKITRLPFKLLDKITPAFIQKKIGVLLDEIGNYVQTGGKYLTQEKMMLKKLSVQSGVEVESIEGVSEVSVEDMKKVCLDIRESRGNLATVQGASTGFGGMFTLAIDIPVLLGLSIKTLQEIAIAHGYDPNKKEERIFIVKCLQFASADIVGKQAVLNELSGYHTRSHSKEVFSQLQGWREVMYSYRDTYGIKKLLQMIPVAGMIFGALTNRSMIKELAETGTMLYQKRRILARLDEIEQAEQEPLQVEEEGTPALPSGE